MTDAMYIPSSTLCSAVVSSVNVVQGSWRELGTSTSIFLPDNWYTRNSMMVVRDALFRDRSYAGGVDRLKHPSVRRAFTNIV